MEPTESELQLRSKLEGYLTGLTIFNQEISIFDFGSVVVQKNYYNNKNVRIISGGPFFNGDMVGTGMLTCFIQGERQVAPSSKLILRTLRELSYNHIKGILLLVSGAPGNFLNFGLALERAINDNLKVRMIQVCDLFDENYSIRKRGSVGIVLLIKIAGAMSEEGKSLGEIYQCINESVCHIFTVGIDRTVTRTGVCKLCIKCVCKNTDHPMSSYISEIECIDAVESLINIIPDDNYEIQENKLNLKPDDCVVVLINNNGSLKKTTEFNLIKNLITFLSVSLIKVKRIFKCHITASFDVTITFMKVCDQTILEYLDTPCSAPGWQYVNQWQYDLSPEEPIPGKLTRRERLSPPIRGPRLLPKYANTLLYATQFACDALISCEKQINLIDEERGSGDAGTKLRLVADVLLRRMQKNKIVTDYPFTFFESLSKTLEIAVGGTAGCIYSILFETAASTFNQYTEDTEITCNIWMEAFEAAAKALQKYGNVKMGEGTLYDPIIVFVNVSKSQLESNKQCIEAFGRGVEAAENAASMTRKEHRYPDSGAHAVGIWMRAVFEGVKLTCPIK